MNSLIPEPIARQPWAMLIPLFVLVCFGAAVLYSAAGGMMQPFAASHLMRFGIFLFTVITALGLSLRSYLEHLKLQMLPRLSVGHALLLLAKLFRRQDRGDGIEFD